MRKRVIALLLCLVLTLGLVACGSSTSSSTSSNSTSENTATDNADYELHVVGSSGYPAANRLTDGFYEPLLEGVKEATGGKFTYDMYTDGSLIALGGEYDALRSNTIDVALTFMCTYDTVRFPLTEVVMLPAIFCDSDVATNTVTDLMASDVAIKDGKTYYQLEWEDNGLFSVNTPATEGYCMLLGDSMKLESASDFNTNYVMRTNSSVMELFCTEVGLTPISVSGAEIYDAMSRGACNGVFLSPDWNAVGICELINEVIDVSLGNSVCHTAVMLEDWNTWPEEVKTAWVETAEDINRNRNFYPENTTQQYEDLFAAGGVRTSFDSLDAGVQEQINNAITATWYHWIDKLEAAGNPGKNLAILYRDLAVANGAIYPDEIMELESYEPNV